MNGFELVKGIIKIIDDNNDAQLDGITKSIELADYALRESFVKGYKEGVDQELY